MKSFVIFLLLLFTATLRIYSENAVSFKDSLNNTLEAMPADSSRLNMLYDLVYQDPMSPRALYYLDRMLEEAIKQGNKKYQCTAMYAHILYYFNHQDEKNTIEWMKKLAEIALENKFYSTYFAGKRAEITMHIIKRKIEYSITEAEEMYKLACKLNNTQGMYSAKLCLMSAYLMSARYKEGEKAGFEAYGLLPENATLASRKEVLQEIALACSSTKNVEFLKYLKEYNLILDKLSQQGNKTRDYNSSYLLLETLYADYYLEAGNMEEARYHLRKMDEYISPADYVPCRGLYYNVYTNYYRITEQYDKALAYSDTTISLLAGISDNGGLNYMIKRGGILTDAGRADEAIPMLQSLLAKKDSFYRELSSSQMEEIYEMRNIENLLLEKEQHKAMIHYIGLALLAIALLILIPSTIRIYYISKRLKKEEEETRKMTLIAEEANEVKSRFLANMSYNIRIPLNNVLGFSQLMTIDPESVDAEQWKEYSEIIQSNSAELIQLVNDVLDLSRLEAGRTKWQLQDYDIIPLCSDVMSMARMKSDNNIQIDFQTDIESQPFEVDIARFTQVILSTLTYSDPCDKQRNISFSLRRDNAKKHFVFRIINSPLAEAELQTQKVEVRHSINRLTIDYFGGTYTIEPDALEGPTIIITYPYS